MAATTLSSTPIDLKSQATYQIRLGASILKPKEAKRFTSIRYNHVPELAVPRDVQSSLKPSRDGTQEELVLTDAKEELKYSGKHVGDGDRYVLVFKKNGGEKEMVLERLEGCHELNLTKTNQEKDAAKLAAKFPPLPSVEDDEDLFGDEEDMEDPVDASDPWDYRNYLKPETSRPVKQSTMEKDRGSATPQAQPRAATSTPVSRPAKRSEGPLMNQKKRKATEAAKTNPKRVKAGTEPPAPATSKPRTDIPKVNVEHKRTAPKPKSDDNSGELILELATPVTEKPPKQTSAMALALSGQLGQGPISLHSAASSPASRIASPMPARPEGMEEGEEFDIGGLDSSPEAPAKAQERQTAEDYFSGAGEEDDGEDGDADADADVEDLELPSPARTHERTKSVGAATAGDEDDDLEQQMMAAMAADDDDAPAPPPPPAESDEESEEE